MNQLVKEMDERIHNLHQCSDSEGSLGSDLIQILTETRDYHAGYEELRNQTPGLLRNKTPFFVQTQMSFELQSKRQLVVAAGTGLGKTFGSLEAALVNGARRIFLTVPPNLSLQWVEKIHEDFDCHVVVMSSDPIQNLDPQVHGNVLKTHGIWNDTKQVQDSYQNNIPGITSLEGLMDDSRVTIVVVPTSYISTATPEEMSFLASLMKWSDASIRDESHQISSSARSEQVEGDEDEVEDEQEASNRHKLMRRLTSDRVAQDPDYLVMSLTATPCPTAEIQKIVNLISMTTGREPLRTGFAGDFRKQSDADLAWASAYVRRHCFVVPAHESLPVGFDPEKQPKFRVADTLSPDYDGMHLLPLKKQELNELANVSTMGCGYHAVTTEDKVQFMAENLLDGDDNVLVFCNWVDVEGKGALQRLERGIENAFTSDLDEEFVISVLGRNLQDTLNGRELQGTTLLENFLTTNTIEPQCEDGTVPPVQTGPKQSSEIVGKAFSILSELGYDTKGFRLGNLLTQSGQAVDSVNSMSEIEEWVREGGKKVLLASRKIATGTDGLQNLFRKVVVLNLPFNPVEVEQLIGRLLRNRDESKCQFWGEPVEVHYVLKAPVENAQTGARMFDTDLKELERLVQKDRIITQIVEGIDPSDNSELDLDEMMSRFERKYSNDAAVVASVTSMSGHQSVITA